MKLPVYLVILLLIIPVQASLLEPFSLGGIKPDAGLALLYCVGLLTSPLEGALFGMALGLVQDIGSADLVGFTAFTRGMIGLLAGLLGRHLLDLANPSNILFITLISIIDGVFTSLFLQFFFGSVPFFTLLFTRTLPLALYTGVLGYLLIRVLTSKKTLAFVKRRSLQKE